MRLLLLAGERRGGVIVTRHTITLVVELTEGARITAGDLAHRLTEFAEEEPECSFAEVLLTVEHDDEHVATPDADHGCSCGERFATAEELFDHIDAHDPAVTS